MFFTPFYPGGPSETASVLWSYAEWQRDGLWDSLSSKFTDLPSSAISSITACNDNNTRPALFPLDLSLRRMTKGYVDCLISQKDHFKFLPVFLLFVRVEPFILPCDWFVCISSVSIHSCGHSRKWVWLCSGTARAARPSWTHGNSHKCWIMSSLNMRHFSIDLLLKHWQAWVET